MRVLLRPAFVPSFYDRGRAETYVGVQEKASSSETVAFLQRDIEERNQALEQQRTLCSEKEGEIQRLLSANGELQMETENMKSMVSLHWPTSIFVELTAGTCRW